MSSLLINDINSSSEMIKISKEEFIFLVGGCDFAPFGFPEKPFVPF